MSIVSLSTTAPTCTPADLHALATTHNFSIPPDTLTEQEFLLFANSFDAVCASVAALPDYEEPKLAPHLVQSERTYHRPPPEENPLNAWSHKATLQSSHPAAATGILAGRTIAVKDNVSVAGLPLTLGASPALLKGGQHPISPLDATVVSRVLAAGATLKGTATCENLSMFALSCTSHTGVVHNAWLPGHLTGGSSSGCAALVSIGDVASARKNGTDARDYPLGEGVDMAIGGDQGGSIRLPAAYSGIYGLKPTHGLVPYTGIASLNPLIDHTGPMARTVDDIALLLQAIAGWDGLDPRASPATPSSPLPYAHDLSAWISAKQSRDEWTPSLAAKGLRVGILTESFALPGIAPSIAAAVKRAAQRFASLGAEVKEISIPLHTHGAAIWTVAARPLMPHFVAGGVPDLLTPTLPHLDPNSIGQGFYDTLAHRNPAAVNVLLNAAHQESKYGHVLARKAYRLVYQLREAYDAAFEEVDVLLTPINPTVGPKIPAGAVMGVENERGESERLMDLFEPAVGNTGNTCVFNVTGHPAMSMPVGWGDVEGGRLPVGMQVVGARCGEGDILKAARAWEVGGSWKDS